MRVKTRWNVKDKERSIDQTASVLAFNIWRIGANAVLELENDGFQTDTQKQRLDVIAEFLVFLLHSTDRLVYGRIDDEQRQGLINALAQHLVRILRENAEDLPDSKGYVEQFVARINTLSDEYAEFGFTDGEPSFGYLRFFADRVAGAMGPRDNKWILDHVMTLEAPNALSTLNMALGNQVAPKPPAGADV